MKREATEHPKFSRLATMFKIQRWMAIGLMESIWHFTAKYAKAGDIGRWSNEEIACGIGWTDDPNILIEGLIKTKFIDKNKNDALSRLKVRSLQDTLKYIHLFKKLLSFFL